MKKLAFIATCFLTLMVTSCTTVKKTSASVNVEAQVKQYPTIADLDIHSKKVEKTYSWYWNPFKREPMLSVLKGNLIAEILQETGGDVLLEPNIIYTKESFGKRTLTVFGFPATFKNFRKATEADLKALEITKDMPANERTEYNMSRGIKLPSFGKHKRR